MSLQEWLSKGRVRAQKTSVKEIRGLIRVGNRDLADARIDLISPDRRFATAYGAALQLATIVVRASGYRTAGVGHHWITFQLLLELLGKEEQERVDYFDSCRQKRNVTDYDDAGLVSQSQVDELISEVAAFRTVVLRWLRAHHPELVDSTDGLL